MTLKERLKKANINRIVLANTVIILTYCFLSSMVMAAETTKQTQILTDIQNRQQAMCSEVRDIKQDMVKSESISNDFADLWAEIDDIKDCTLDIKLFELQTEMNALDKIEDKEKWFLEYKDIVERYKEYAGAPVSIYEVYTEDEIVLLERMVQTEIGSGTFESKVHVADVVWNRIESEKWPNTITGVITSPNQFSYGATMITESTRLAVEYSFMFPDETDGALAFHSMKTTSTFGGYSFIFFDGYHNFFGEVIKDENDDGLLLRQGFEEKDETDD